MGTLKESINDKMEKKLVITNIILIKMSRNIYNIYKTL